MGVTGGINKEFSSVFKKGLELYLNLSIQIVPQNVS
jgi:hypothetical protein